MRKTEFRSWKSGVRSLMLIIFYLLSSNYCFGQFTTEYDTLLILSGDSSTVVGWTYDATADTANGTPYTGYTAGIDLNGKHLVGVDFDTSAAFTAAKFGIQTSAIYNSDADTVGGTAYDWKTINYEGDLYTFTPEVGAINILKPQAVYGLKRYVRFICLDGSSNWNVNEAAPRKLIALIRSGY